MNVDVTITSTSATVSKVDRSAVNVSRNDTITWTNMTADLAILFIPHKKLADNQNQVHRQIAANGGTAKVKITTGTRRSYSYGIFCHDTNSFATGSDPEIIVQ